MSRGSRASGGGGGSFATRVEMQGGTGNIDSRGKSILNKKYFVTNAEELDSAPTITDYKPTNITYTRINETAYEQNVVYEGQTNTSDVTTSITGVKGNIEMFCSFETTPIERHPRITKLAKDFGGYFTPAGDAKFPATYIPIAGTGLGGGKPIDNPMFGVFSYKEATLILRHTYFVQTIDASIWDTTGKVVTLLPTGIPIPKGEKDKDGKEIPRKFMMQAPSITRQGDAWQVVQEYVILNAKAVADGLYTSGVIPAQK
jgi:hypothetical protein